MLADKMRTTLCLTLTLLGRHISATAPSGYMLSKVGESCSAACHDYKLSCSTDVETHNSSAIFKELGVTCAAAGGKSTSDWWAADQPSVATANDPTHPSDCLGYIGAPKISDCGASYPTVRRLCHCGTPCADTCWTQPCGQKPCGDYPPNQSQKSLTIGTGLSGGSISTAESTLFAYTRTSESDAHSSHMNHFWSTCSAECERGLIVRYYLDGEKNASIEFNPAMAAGVGFNDPKAPWGTKWIGLGAGKCEDRNLTTGCQASGGGTRAWFNNFKVPFTTSVRITLQHDSGHFGGFYAIVRGAVNTPLLIGGVALPKAAKLQLHKVESSSVKPLDWVTVAAVPQGFSGQFFLSALAVNNSGQGGLQFLEGCYHMYDGDPETALQRFPGTVLSTGTEDYFDSGWYFDAGEFHLPVSGFTHLVSTPAKTEWSAYRFHEMDPLRFADGFRMDWRCGDLSSPSPNGGGKCYSLTEGRPVGTPTCEHVRSYGWVYVWPNDVTKH